jgi:uncharacterized protein (TIGR03435 family)
VAPKLLLDAQLLLTLCLALFVSALWAQSFEVASVKLNKSGRNPGSTSRSGGQFVLENTSLRECIAIAYGISADRDYALTGPAWIGSERYDIVAKVPAETPTEQVLRMLQALLAERFHLRLHRESKDLRVYLLTLARTGAKLKAVPAGEGSFTFGAGHISCRATSLAEFADKLSRPMFGVGAPVIDSTGLAGVFDFTLDWTPDNASPEAVAGPALFSALQEQLGLKLEPSKSRIEVLVIDHVDRIPTDN